MKKKFVASLLSLMLLLNCLGSMVFSPVYAEGTPITTDKIIKVIKQVEEKLPQDNADVARAVWLYASIFVNRPRCEHLACGPGRPVYGS